VARGLEKKKSIQIQTAALSNRELVIPKVGKNETNAHIFIL
jgi:hypothetical protein